MRNNWRIIRQILFIYAIAFLLAGVRAYAQAPNEAALNKHKPQTMSLGAIRHLHPKKPILRKTKHAVIAAKLRKRKVRKLYAIIDTNMGKIKIRLFDQIAPKTVANFEGLAMGTKEYHDPKNPHKMIKGHFYDGLTFHRVIAHFMIQGGDPLGNGMGGPGYHVPDEFTNEIEFNRPGIVAMANTGRPNSGGSQFFITVAPYPSLNHKYTIFGEVVEGMDVVYAISKVPTNPNDKPLKPVIMKTVRITHS